MSMRLTLSARGLARSTNALAALSRRGPPPHPRISSTSLRRCMNTTTTATKDATTNTTTTKTSSMRWRVVGFLGFTGIVGAGVAAYVLATDREALYYYNAQYPRAMNYILPWLGYPQNPDTGALDFEELGPSDIRDVVGSTVSLLLKLRSGEIVVQTAGALEEPDAVVAKVLASRPGDAVLEMTVLDDDRAEALSKLSQEQLQNEFGVVLPSIPSVVTEHTLEVALALCVEMEIDLTVRSRLQGITPAERQRVTRALTELEHRKAVLNEMLAKERASKPRPSIGERLKRLFYG